MFAAAMTAKEVEGWLMLGIAALIAFVFLRKKPFRFRGTEHGTSRWTTDKELKQRGMLGED